MAQLMSSFAMCSQEGMSAVQNAPVPVIPMQSQEEEERERVLFIGTQFSILYTSRGRGGTSHECCCRHGPKGHRSGRPEERLLHLLHLLRLVVVQVELLEHLALTGEMCWVLITVHWVVCGL